MHGERISGRPQRATGEAGPTWTRLRSGPGVGRCQQRPGNQGMRRHPEIGGACSGQTDSLRSAGRNHKQIGQFGRAEKGFVREIDGHAQSVRDDLSQIIGLIENRAINWRKCKVDRTGSNRSGLSLGSRLAPGTLKVRPSPDRCARHRCQPGHRPRPARQWRHRIPPPRRQYCRPPRSASHRR